MNCPRCGMPVTMQMNRCSQCGQPVHVYLKIIRISNSLYNIGLERARVRDLSGAVDALNKSLKCNKNNINARNLLGLVYYEMGETVMALTEWILSKNICPEDNEANNYIDSIQSNPARLDSVNQTIKKYNAALAAAKQGSDDMAIIQLKKVLNQNPNFIKAYQLLTLLYTKNGQYERAKRTIKKCMKIDKCNPLSIRYLREINEYLEDEKKNNPDRRMERRRSLRGTMVDRPYLSGNDVIIPKDNLKDALTGAQSILHIVIGILLGAALVYFLVTPARISSVTGKVNDTKVEYNQKIAIKNSTISELQNQVDTLKKEKGKLKTSLAQYTGTGNTISTNYSNLLEAAQYFMDKDYANAATAFAKVDKDMKMDSEAFTNVYNKLSGKLTKQVESTAFDKGMEAYESTDYDEAITQFKKVLDSNKDNDEAMYYLAYSYYRNSDNTNAKKWFKKIVDDYPDSDFADKASNILTDI